MKMEYVNVNGYLIPKLENGPITDNTIGKYGMMRARYLDEHRPMERDQMLLDGTLAQHLTNIDCEAHTSSKQYLIHHAGSRKSSLSLFAAAHGIAVS